MGFLAVIVGFGVVGAAAARHLLAVGTPPADIAVIDSRRAAVAHAVELELHARLGDGTHRATVRGVVSARTTHLIVAAGRDETAVMATLLARDLCPLASVITAVRSAETIRHARVVGADIVLATSEWTGKKLAKAIEEPR